MTDIDLSPTRPRPSRLSTVASPPVAGQAMVEFALVAPMFFLLLFGIIEAGRFIFYYETLNNATREGARYAIVNGANTLGCPSGPPAPAARPVRPDRQQRRGPGQGPRRSVSSGRRDRQRRMATDGTTATTAAA